MRLAIALAVVILIGSASRLAGRHLPQLISKDLGDALWATMFFLMVASLRARWPSSAVALAGFLIVSGIEFLKLYDGPPIHRLRAGQLGGFLLGSRFLWSNFIAYAAGIVVGIAVDLRLLRVRRR